MAEKVIAYDFGTGGIKASVFDCDGTILCFEFEAYETYYPKCGWHEQKPKDWLDALIKSTRLLIKQHGAHADIRALAISGHSLGAVPVDIKGNLLRELTPIWSDSRACTQAAAFFGRHSYESWYRRTGNGFPPHLYTIFKIKWYQENEPEMFEKTHKILGTKDYVNYLLTGEICTDHSYASGTGVYNLKKRSYDEELIRAFDIHPSILPDIAESTHVLGELTKDAANMLGLKDGVKVVCGGVDNSCMALGAKGIREGRVYTSLGSSAWIAAVSGEPVIDQKSKPFVFAHCIPGLYTSATSIFSASTSYNWVQETLCKNIVDKHKEERFSYIDKLAATSPVGANKLIFNPSLAGGSGLDESPNMRGMFFGLDLKHSQADILRATMEGIALNLKVALNCLADIVDIENKMLMVGGGSKSPFWRQLFADVYGMNIVKTNIDQSAGSLGAAALAFAGMGIWKGFDIIDRIHCIEDIKIPDKENCMKYEQILKLFIKLMKTGAKYAEELYHLDI